MMRDDSEELEEATETIEKETIQMEELVSNLPSCSTHPCPSLLDMIQEGFDNMIEALKVPPDIFQLCRYNLMSPESSNSIYSGTDSSNYSSLIVYFGGFPGGLGEV